MRCPFALSSASTNTHPSVRRSLSRCTRILALPLLAVGVALAGCDSSGSSGPENGDDNGAGTDLPAPIYSESAVPEYTLPSLLTTTDGDSVTTPNDWWNQRRPQLLRRFRAHVYGQLPPTPPTVRVEHHSSDPSALDSTALRRHVTLHFTDRSEGPALDLLVFVPTEAEGPVPIFAGLNARGNHAVLPSDDWPVRTIIDRGYGLVVAHYGDLFPDRPEGFNESVYQIHAAEHDTTGGTGSALSAWAWGFHRMVDYAAQTDAIDADRVIAVGHSRLGKAALWAGATDRRLAAVVDNASGCGGSALFRRRYGERIVHIDTRFPHWFRDRFSQYRENESALPVDQHQLLALMAPRPVLVSAKTQDRWADPKGMFVSIKHASPAWTVLGHQGLATRTLPMPDAPVLSRAGYHLRSGEHTLNLVDWGVFLDHADRHVRSSDPS